MKDVTSANFGLLIAYLLPGFVVLWGIGQFSETVHSWFGPSSDQSPSVGGFLYVTLGAVAAGLFVSTIRWATIDKIHHHTGIPEPRWNFAALNRNLDTFELLVASHYRYYQFSANMLVAVVLALIAFLVTQSTGREHVGLTAFGVMGTEIVLWLGSRDTLRKYYRRTDALMHEEIRAMTGENSSRGTQLSSGSEYRPTDRRKNGLKIEGPYR